MQDRFGWVLQLLYMYRYLRLDNMDYNQRSRDTTFGF